MKRPQTQKIKKIEISIQKIKFWLFEHIKKLMVIIITAFVAGIVKAIIELLWK